jgi:acetyl esterase
MNRSYASRVSVLSLVSVVAVAGVYGCEKPRSEPAPTTTPAAAPSPELRSGTMTANDNKPMTTATTATETKMKDPLAAADADMKKVLEQLGMLGGKPLETLSAEEARKQPTPADAVKAVLTKDGKSIAPMEVGKVEDRKIPGAAGPIAVRIVTPKKADATKPMPVIVYFHGGGWVIASNDVYDSSIRALANKAGAKVVAVDYRMAPENKFPAQHDDALASYEWVLKNAASFGGDPKRVAVAGESAGGNLAANVSIAARDKGIQMPVHELLVYPIASTSMDTQSYREWAKAKPLSKDMMGWFFDKTERTPADAKDTRLDLVNAKLTGLPPTTIVLAEIDPLHAEGEMLGKKLKEAGVDVDMKTYDGVTHEFFGMGAAVGDAKDAMDYAGGRLEKALKAR